ncbi:ABC transporter permease, partial [Vibrio fortis]
MFVNYIAGVGRRTLAMCEAFGRASLMLWGAFFGIPRLKNFPLLVKQLYSVGVQSLAIQMVALSLLRELGPVVTALLFAGVGRRTLAMCEAFGRASLMLWGAFFGIPRLKNFPLLVKQLYSVGVQSLA